MNRLPIVQEKFLDVYRQHATGHDVIMAGNCRLHEDKGIIIPLIGKFVEQNPDGIFADYTLSLAMLALKESYKDPNCDSLLGILLNNVQIGTDLRTLRGEPDIRMKQAEYHLADYILELRELWAQDGLPKRMLAWFSIGGRLLPFALESHYRSMMDNRVGELARKTEFIMQEQTDQTLIYYYVPNPGTRHVITAFPKRRNIKLEKTPEIASPIISHDGIVCNGTGCSGQVAILAREVEFYEQLGTHEKFNPHVLFNLAPMVCYQPVNVGTQFAYDVYKVHIKTVNVFFDPDCHQMSVTVFEP